MIEERMMLKGALPDGREVRALNDVVVTRLGSLRTVRFNLFVNGELLNCYQADGIIISTPTGSTAYNLSAGGPIVEPQASLIVVTPICSHALNASSIVLSSESEIVIEIGEGKNGGTEIAGITFDGCEMTELRTGEQVYIRKAEEKTKFLRLSKISFLEILHRKMKGN
ncbi:MAG: NAD(+)/NADH kinase, partial [Lachnospiraceae bacterium]